MRLILRAGALLMLMALRGTFWANVSKLSQADELNGTITYKQSALTSLMEYLDYSLSPDRDHYIRSAYDLMITTRTQYLWSYRQWCQQRRKWIPFCSVEPTPYLNDSGRIFRRAPSIAC